jgi:hypothetical protein
LPLFHLIAVVISRRNQTRYAPTPALSHREREIERELSAGVTDWAAFWYQNFFPVTGEVIAK